MNVFKYTIDIEVFIVCEIAKRERVVTMDIIETIEVCKLSVIPDIKKLPVPHSTLKSNVAKGKIPLGTFVFDNKKTDPINLNIRWDNDSVWDFKVSTSKMNIESVNKKLKLIREAEEERGTGEKHRRLKGEELKAEKGEKVTAFNKAQGIVKTAIGDISRYKTSKEREAFITSLYKAVHIPLSFQLVKDKKRTREGGMVKLFEMTKFSFSLDSLLKNKKISQDMTKTMWQLVVNVFVIVSGIIPMWDSSVSYRSQIYVKDSTLKKLGPARDLLSFKTDIIEGRFWIKENFHSTSFETILGSYVSDITKSQETPTAGNLHSTLRDALLVKRKTLKYKPGPDLVLYFFMWLNEKANILNERDCVMKIPRNKLLETTTATSGKLKPSEYHYAIEYNPFERPDTPVYISSQDTIDFVGTCRDKKLRLLIPLTIHDRDGETRLNTIVVDFERGVAERFDPNPTAYGFSHKIDTDLKNYWKDKGVPTYVSPFDYCPVHKSILQDAQSRQMFSTNMAAFCLAWSLLYIHVRVLYPTWSRESIVSYMQSLPEVLGEDYEEDVGSMIARYTNWIMHLKEMYTNEDETVRKKREEKRVKREGEKLTKFPTKSTKLPFCSNRNKFNIRKLMSVPWYLDSCIEEIGVSDAYQRETPRSIRTVHRLIPAVGKKLSLGMFYSLLTVIYNKGPDLEVENVTEGRKVFISRFVLEIFAEDVFSDKYIADKGMKSKNLRLPTNRVILHFILHTPETVSENDPVLQAVTQLRKRDKGDLRWIEVDGNDYYVRKSVESVIIRTGEGKDRPEDVSHMFFQQVFCYFVHLVKSVYEAYIDLPSSKSVDDMTLIFRMPAPTSKAWIVKATKGLFQSVASEEDLRWIEAALKEIGCRKTIVTIGKQTHTFMGVTLDKMQEKLRCFDS